MPDLRFDGKAIAAGIATAQSVWNRIPTDFPVGDGTYHPLAGSDGYVADAGYAYAVLSEAARIDGLKLPVYAGGPAGPIVLDPVPNLTRSVGDALNTVRDFARWAAEAKPRLAAKMMEI